MCSDGLVNHGKKAPAQIARLVKKIRTWGISISSFGIGADFDEELMKSISEYLIYLN
jgi:Ca-activated chloride channel family protein